MKKKFNPRIKARIRKNKQVLNKKIDNFFIQANYNSNTFYCNVNFND